MTPLEIVKKYNEECWDAHRPELAADLLADKVVRNYIGETKILTREESVERMRDGIKQLPGLKFNFHKFIEAGEFVTLIWDADSKDVDGKDFTSAGIEVFRVEDGKICEVWNSEYSMEPGKRWQ